MVGQGLELIQEKECAMKKLGEPLAQMPTVQITRGLSKDLPQPTVSDHRSALKV